MARVIFHLDMDAFFASPLKFVAPHRLIPQTGNQITFRRLFVQFGDERDVSVYSRAQVERLRFTFL